MKLSIIPLLTLTPFLGLLPSCEKKTTPEKIEDKVDDALDRRPAEKIQDAAEDVKDEVKDATN